MSKFEFVKEYAAAGLPLPSRSTADSAGYDFVVAWDTIIPSYHNLWHDAVGKEIVVDKPMTLEDISDFTKRNKCKPTLVPTGVKCKLDKRQYLELSVRSSTPLKHWIFLANGVGIIDRDYYNNPDNEGHIYFQVINLSPFDIVVKKGEKIGQGIIRNYNLTEDDAAAGQRIGGFGSTNG